VGLNTVDLFIDSSDFFTIDVADFIGNMAPTSLVDPFVRTMRNLVGKIDVPGMGTPLEFREDDIRAAAQRYLIAVREAGRIYRHIASAKGSDNFITEVSMDETVTSQSPKELFFILAAIAAEGIPIQTIAPKFSGKFLKGVDYVGPIGQFAKEFEEDLLVLAFAVKQFSLPKNLKLSVHSGSDKFSLYPSIHGIIRKHNAGLHLKTAGTTWLEELIGLAMTGGKEYAASQAVYCAAYKRIDELCKPYESVIDIDQRCLPHPDVVNKWNNEEFVATLRHDGKNPRYNKHFRRLMHIAYRLAAEMDEYFRQLLTSSSKHISKNVTENLYVRHIKPLFLGL
jgi:tagaturonate epimerase